MFPVLFVNWILVGCLGMVAVCLVPIPKATVYASPQEVSRSVSGGSVAEAAEPAPVPAGPEVSAPSDKRLADSLPTPRLQDTPAEGAAGKVLPAGQPALLPSREEYRIEPEDVLRISVYEEPDLSTKVRVASSGDVHFPLLGRLHVQGLSVPEIQQMVTDLLAEDYLLNPQVQVFIESYHARNVFVTGAVNNPGSYRLPAGKPTSALGAITMAGGFREDAAVNSTRIIRLDENGQALTIDVKAKDILKKGDKSKDVEVRPDDVIVVPESFF